MTVNASEIPLISLPQQLTVQLVNVVYTFTLKWNAAANTWGLDIGDSENNPILQGLLLVTGLDLLAQYEYLGLGFQLFVQTDNNPDAVPLFTNLGITAHLYAVPVPLPALQAA